MRAVTSKRTGKEFWLITRDEVEAAPGSRPTHGGRRLRSACPIHDGDNREAFELNLETGWGRCFTHDCTARLVEPHELMPTQPGQHLPPRPPRPVPIPPTPEEIAQRDQRLDDLAVSMRKAVQNLPGSPGADYLSARHIPIDTATAYGLGWAGDRIRDSMMKPLANRVLIPLSRPDGVVTSITGRAIDTERNPKYWNLPAEFYEKGWFNASAIAAARETGATLWVCEGPIDALAMLAGGARYSVSVAGPSDFREQWLRGLHRVIVCFDVDSTGQKRRIEWVSKLSAIGVDALSMPLSALEGCHDLAEFWAQHGRLPAIIVDAIAEEAEPDYISQPPANMRPLHAWTMRAALDACEALPPEPKLAGYVISYELLRWNEETLRSFGEELAEDLRRHAAEEPLPEELAVWLFALKNSRYMKRMRRPAVRAA